MNAHVREFFGRRTFASQSPFKIGEVRLVKFVRRTLFVVTLLGLAILCAPFSINQVAGQEAAQTESQDSPQTLGSDRKQIIRDAFIAVHNGFSSDEVILQDPLNRAFIARCRQQLPNATAVELNWTLLNMRKAGHLKGIKTTRRGKPAPISLEHIAEISARQIQDANKQSIDRVLVDPQLRQEFDDLARRLNPEADLYLVRKSALKLRKTRKLQPELITRIADWDRNIAEFSAAAVADDFDLVPPNPGIYIFRDKTGYLYIGQSENLRLRLQSHLDESSSVALANYLNSQGAKNISIEIHSFPRDSRARETRVRRAYESELIRNRKPRFNIQP